MDSALACNSRLQRLLWTRDYFPLAEEVILIESAFVFDKKNGFSTKMVQVGLTSTTILIAEEKLSSISPSNINLHRPTSVSNPDLELFEMIFLFPLEHVRLSVRTHSEDIGEHVIRLRLCSGPKWYLELSDPWHREDKWHEWVWWIHELEQRRRREHKMKRRQQKVKGAHHASVSANERTSLPHSSSPLDDKDKPSDIPEAGKSDSSTSLNQRLPSSHPTGFSGRRQSTAQRWVHHFAEHMIDHHDETLRESDDDVEDHHVPYHQNDSGKTKTDHLGNSKNPLLSIGPRSKENLSAKPSNIWRESQLNLQHSFHHSRHTSKSHHRKNLLTNRVQSIIDADGVDSLSSLEDVQSVGSIVSSTAESWSNKHAKDSRKGLLLSVGDLFGKVNFEAHAHGHVGRARPMASMTRLDVLLSAERRVEHGDDQRLLGVNKAQLHHTSSLPDILDGEAEFLEDLPNADDVTHRMSLVYLDLENDDEQRSPHVINGHVILLTKEQLTLHHKVDKLRASALDERLTYSLRGSKKAKESDEKDTKKKKRRWSVSIHSQSKGPNLNFHVPNLVGNVPETSPSRVSKPASKRMSIFFAGGNRTLPIVREHIDYLSDINPNDLANELTAIDTELFLRIREAEFIGCAWLKEEGHYRANNLMATIEFFKKVAGMVAYEVLRSIMAAERADVLAHFLTVAKRLKEKRNFHSLRAVLAGLQTPAVHRLHNTWEILEEQFTEEFQIWTELLEYTDLETRSLDNDPELDQAMMAPPCLAFLGSILMRIIDFYATVDISGTRIAHKMYDHVVDDRSSVTDRGSMINIVEGHSLDDGSDEEERDDVTEEITTPSANHNVVPRLNSFLKKMAHKLDVIVSKHSLTTVQPKARGNANAGGMDPERKRYIRKLIIEYAKSEAEEDMAIFARNARATRRGGAAAAVLGVDSHMRAKLLEDFTRASQDQSKVDPNRSRHYAELHQMAHAHDDMPWKHRWTSEYHLHKSLLLFQLAAVAFEPNEGNHEVREFLLADCKNDVSGTELFRLSLEREPPT